MPEAVEARTIRPERAKEVLECPRLLEVPGVDRLVARVPAQLLDDLARLVVRGVEFARPLRLLVDPVVEPREVEVERLRNGPARDRLHLVGQRRELVVS